MHGCTSYPPYYAQFIVYSNCFAHVVGSYTRNSYAPTPMDRLHAVPSKSNYTSQSECPILWSVVFFSDGEPRMLVAESL